MISIVVPVYNEADTLAETIDRLRALPGEKEILIADGGSTDGTAALAADRDVLLLHTPKGRARQMNAAAKRASGQILWFVHSDSHVCGTSLFAIKKAVRNGCIGGCFSLYFHDGKGFNLWWIGHTSNLRARFLRLMFGDQGLFLTRDAFEKLGGFSDIPIMEDWDLSVRAHKAGRMCVLSECIGTSARRFQENGTLRTLWQLHRIKLGYLRGVAPEELAKEYREIR